MTESEKIGLITYDKKFDFSPKTQIKYQIHNQNELDLSGLLLMVCFSQAQWQSVRVVWGLNGALTSLGMAVCDCIALWY